MDAGKIKDMTPIRVRYKNKLFRSKLEARWAVAFDTLRIRWEYEPKLFTFANGIKYLPDFRIESKQSEYMWVEFKGQQPSLSEKEKCALLHKATNKPVILIEGCPGESDYFYQNVLHLDYGDKYLPVFKTYYIIFSAENIELFQALKGIDDRYKDCNLDIINEQFYDENDELISNPLFLSVAERNTLLYKHPNGYYVWRDNRLLRVVFEELFYCTGNHNEAIMKFDRVRIDYKQAPKEYIEEVDYVKKIY